MYGVDLGAIHGTPVRPLPSNATDDDLLCYIDRWAALLEAEDYDAAFHLTEHDPYMQWTPALIREVIKAFGEGRESQRITVEGEPTDIRQKKEVTWFPSRRASGDGEIRYDLNIDGFVSDLTATFWIERTASGIVLRLNDIHVM